MLGFLTAESALCAGFPSEVYSFYAESEVQAILTQAGFEPAQFRRIGDQAADAWSKGMARPSAEHGAGAVMDGSPLRLRRERRIDCDFTRSMI